MEFIDTKKLGFARSAYFNELELVDKGKFIDVAETVKDCAPTLIEHDLENTELKHRVDELRQEDEKELEKTMVQPKLRRSPTVVEV